MDERNGMNGMEKNGMEWNNEMKHDRDAGKTYDLEFTPKTKNRIYCQQNTKSMIAKGSLSRIRGKVSSNTEEGQTDRSQGYEVYLAYFYQQFKCGLNGIYSLGWIKTM